MSESESKIKGKKRVMVDGAEKPLFHSHEGELIIFDSVLQYVKEKQKESVLLSIAGLVWETNYYQPLTVRDMKDENPLKHLVKK